MKLGNLLVVASLLIGSAAFAQDGEENRECLRMRVIANNAMAATNYKEATTYFIKGEAICDDFGKDNYERLLSCVMNVVDASEGDQQLNYMDTLMWVYERMEEKGVYDKVDDITRGYYYIQLREKDYIKADTYLKRGIEAQGMDMNEQFITLYYFNLYTLWYIEQDEAAKAGYTQRLINEYFWLSKLIKDANYAPSIQEGLTGYLGQVITSCDDLLPQIPAFMESLPEEAEIKKVTLLDMARLLDAKGCVESDEFGKIVDMLYEIDANDPEIIEMVIKTAKTPAERIEAYKKLLMNAQTDEDRNYYSYKIAYEYFVAGNYKTAYSKSTGVTGEYRGRALELMGKSVAATAMSCGNSTFERKCNYLYAVQLLEQAQAAGGTGALSGTIESYRSKAPSSSECFDEGNPSSVTLTCWSVSVSPCN